MSKQGISRTFDLGDGRSISIETGKLAKQAHGSAVVKYGDTMLLATVVAKEEVAVGIDFLPLSVDYKEKYASSGRFPGGFFKREARPTDHEILISRLVDRAIRPLFPAEYQSETQVMITLISADKDVMPDAFACLAATSALAVSDIPFNGPISEVRIARIDGEFMVNPPLSKLSDADMNIMVAATIDNIVMVEGEMREVQEEDLVQAMKLAHDAIKIELKAVIELAEMVEKSRQKRELPKTEEDIALKEKLHIFASEKIKEIVREGIADKTKRKESFSAILDEFKETFSEEELEEKNRLISTYFHELEKNIIRDIVMDEKVRLDGRNLDEIRHIWGEVDYLPAAHGSAIFTRGETQSLTTVTLGTKLDEQTIDGAVIEGKSNFLLHYNFPGFSTGEVKPNRGTSRREIGHGNLAHRALKPVLPGEMDNPYTVRIVSDILESNGSSSMATVCAGSMALMDAGVKITKPVSGIAMGLISDNESGKYAILSDILGDEDHLGDMDFKVTGTVDGITACQMDIKIDGLSYEILAEALEQAKRGRLHILDKIKEVIKEPMDDYKPFVPRIEKMQVAKEFIGAIIGPGGKIIQEIQNETGCTIVIEEVGEFGIIDIVSADKDSIDEAKEWIKKIVAVPEVGEVYSGKIKSIVSFGAFVEYLPGKEGLLHISEIAWKRLNSVEDELKEGEEIEVKLIGIDQKTGKVKLSRKALLPKPNNN